MHHNHFTPSEAAAVINLQIGTADEARKLIPTLNVSMGTHALASLPLTHMLAAANPLNGIMCTARSAAEQ